MNSFPFLSLEKSLIVLRVSVAVIFLSHSIVRIANSTIPQFGGFLESKGFPYGVAWVWAITVFEIFGGILLALGFFTKWLSLGFILMLIVGIALIHASLGWFVGEHGTGGSEYSFILIMALLVISASDKRI
ncbi:MAG: DoxX family protein [Acidobacteriota bacterium]